MVLALARLFGSRQWNRGFTLIELLIVILIVGILAAVATPLYLGYIKDAKTAEAKALAGSVWTALQGVANAGCNKAVPITDALPKAGLDQSGKTADSRWTVNTGGSLTVNCTTGAVSGGSPLFTVTGAAKDVNFIQVKMNYDASGTPPAKLQCSTDSGATFVDC